MTTGRINQVTILYPDAEATGHNPKEADGTWEGAAEATPITRLDGTHGTDAAGNYSNCPH